MVTINPAMVIGPFLQPVLNTSAAAILNLINGSQTFPNSTFGWVNVEDVANAHIQAFEIPSANGRYCLVESIAHYSEVVKILQKQFLLFNFQKRSQNRTATETHTIVSQDQNQTSTTPRMPRGGSDLTTLQKDGGQKHASTNTFVGLTSPLLEPMGQERLLSPVAFHKDSGPNPGMGLLPIPGVTTNVTVGSVKVSTYFVIEPPDSPNWPSQALNIGPRQEPSLTIENSPLPQTLLLCNG
ncbi:Tetraketide alpha-pyrone reductase 2 [Camellia lanceoleosa]|uniref:Tetraketide alpha-pyrone reductase 2 n=1 Tax=Camellia lanceoleosa TaxID=1840588 RepID=A0ACC0F4M2_9ERIC|nr:Tetraketide alpha-pyrone reductase 2 [Camellia lanceoleosa]